MLRGDFKKSAARGTQKEHVAGAGSGVGAGTGISRQAQPQAPQLTGPQLTGPRPPMPKGAFVMPVTQFATGAKTPPATGGQIEKADALGTKDSK